MPRNARKDRHPAARLRAGLVAAAFLAACLLVSGSAGASPAPDRIVPLAGGSDEAEEWGEVPPADATPPADEGSAPSEEHPTYDLRVVSSILMDALTSSDGVVWVPLARSGRQVRVAEVPTYIHRRDLARCCAPNVVVMSDSLYSQRHSLPTTLHFRTRAPLRIPRGGFEFFTHDSGLVDCRATDDALGRGVDCDVASIAPGRAGFARANRYDWGPLAEAHHGRLFPFRWDLVCGSPTEADCTNNSLRGTFGLSIPPQTNIGRIGVGRFRGDATGPRTEVRSSRSQSLRAVSARRKPRRTVKRADRPTRIEIALVRLAKGQRGFRGGEISGGPGPDQTDLTQGRQCRWVSNRRRQFTAVSAVNGICADPVWLRAKLRKPRKGAKAQPWTFGLRKRLRPGRYALYSKATTRRGMPEMVFSKKRGNRVEFRVRKRGGR